MRMLRPAACTCARNWILKTRAGFKTLELFARDIMAIAIAHNGTTTGEHGEGLARSYFNRQLYGARLHQAFREVKSLFDPSNSMNPERSSMHASPGILSG
jgi:FAD/FMN-containing dehydrogenase